MARKVALVLYLQTKKEMLVRLFLLAVLSASAAVAAAQKETPPPLQIYAGYSWLSNSFNGLPGSRKALNGWNGGLVFPPWRHLRFKIDYSMYRGTNSGDPQHAFFIMGGWQYRTATFHRERFYTEALVGEGGLNGNWFIGDATGYLHGDSGSTASLAEFLGGGIDTPISHHTAIRVEGGVQHSGFAPIYPEPRPLPYHLDGIPNYFGRFSVGMVWLPRLGSAVRQESLDRIPPVESEIIYEGLQSFGHFKIFAVAQWVTIFLPSRSNTIGIRGERLAGARFDYSAGHHAHSSFTPASRTRRTNRGNPMSKTFETFPGIGIAPIGFRLLWRDSKGFKPYFVAEGLA